MRKAAAISCRGSTARRLKWYARSSVFRLSNPYSCLIKSGFRCRFCASIRRTFMAGPDNWARVQIRALDAPEADGSTHRVVIAFDTRVAEGDDEQTQLAPTPDDVKNGINFALAWHNEELLDFLDQTWVDGWLREVFTEQAAIRELREVRNIKVALREFEYQAHYLNVLGMLGSQLGIRS